MAHLQLVGEENPVDAGLEGFGRVCFYADSHHFPSFSFTLNKGILRGDRLVAVHVQVDRSEEHTSELQSLTNLVCRLLLEKKNNSTQTLVLLQKRKPSHGKEKSDPSHQATLVQGYR